MSINQGEELRKFLLINEISPENVAIKLKKAKGTIYNWLKKSELTYEQIQLLKDGGIDFLNKSSNNNMTIVKEGEQKYNNGNIVDVPIAAYGGFLQGYSNKVYLDSLEHFSLPGVHGLHFQVRAEGMSMTRFIYPNEKALTRPEESFQNMVKNRAYVLATVDGVIFKFFDHIKGEYGYFKCANPDYEDIKLHLKDIKKVYQIVEVRVDPYLRYEIENSLIK